MITVIVKQFGWKKSPIGAALEFPDKMLDELKKAQQNGLCSIEKVEIEKPVYEIDDDKWNGSESLINKEESEET